MPRRLEDREDPLGDLFPPGGGTPPTSPTMPTGPGPGGADLPPDLVGINPPPGSAGPIPLGGEPPEAGGPETPPIQMGPGEGLAGGDIDLPPDLGAGEQDVFSAPLPPVPLSLPPNVGGVQSKSTPQRPGGLRSFLPFPTRQRRQGPGVPFAGEEGVEDPDRLRLIYQALGI